jgi:transposase
LNAEGLFPEHLPRKEVVITPDEPITEDMRRLPDRITEVLDYVPGRLVVIRYIRHCYIKDVEGGLRSKKVMGAKPERPIFRCLASAALLAQIICDKYCDHLPLYRQLQRFERAGVRIGSSTFDSWVKKIAQLLTPLYEELQKEVVASNYLRVDETPIKVLDREKDKNIHQGYLWYYQSPKACFIQYHSSRGSDPPDKILGNFQGKLQTDGYGVYDHFGENEHITLFGCWAHARRKIFEVSKAHPSLTEAPLEFIGELYLIEKEIRTLGLEPAEAVMLRQQKASTPLLALMQWMEETKPKLKPKMKLYKAIEYIENRWQKLIRYLWHGEVQIDNNLVENAIRPAALGRKNYLFAGSQKAAKNTAIFYSLMGSCKMAGVNPLEWLTDVIKNINNQPIQKLSLLLPSNWKNTQV